MIDGDRDHDPDNFVSCKRETAQMVDFDVCICGSLNCNKNIHLI